MERIFEEMKRINKALLEKYLPDANWVEPKDAGQTCVWLNGDIGAILTEKGLDVADEIVAFIKESPCGDEILYGNEYVKMDALKDEASIRLDFDAALSKVKYGSDLSRRLGWGFSNNDITNLAALHRSNKHRRKIEDLLEDCNFHTECGAFAEGEYEDYLPNWEVHYRVGNTYKYKVILALDSDEAIRRAKVKNVIEVIRLDVCAEIVK